MRHILTVLCLLAVIACSKQPSEQLLIMQHVIPNDFSGAYKIAQSSDSDAGYTVEGNHFVLPIPADGVLTLGVGQSDYRTMITSGLSAKFADGRHIPLFAPDIPPPDGNYDTSMLLGIAGNRSGDTVWFAIGNHMELSKLHAQILAAKFQGLDDLPLGTAAIY